MISNITMVSKSCERICTEPIAAIEDINSVVDVFIADNSMSITKKKNPKPTKSPSNSLEHHGKQNGQVYMTVQSDAAYNRTMAMIATDIPLCTEIAGAGSDATEDEPMHSGPQE